MKPEYCKGCSLMKTRTDTCILGKLCVLEHERRMRHILWIPRLMLAILAGLGAFAVSDFVYLYLTR